MSRVSLQETVHRLGLSVGTASGAFCDSSGRKVESVRERTRALAKKLGYKPSVVARSTRQGAMPIIGLVAEGLITQPLAAEIISSVKNAARRVGLSIFATRRRRR